MGCFTSKDLSEQTNNQTQIYQNFTEYSDFSKYYKYIRKCLKVQNFKFGNSQDPFSFKKRLASMNGISTKIAKIWISAYLDYMILATWSYCLGTKSIIYPPYAIQQVARLHTCYRNNYKRFIMIITENKKQSFYFPQRLIAQQDPLEYYSFRYSYQWAKNFLSELYENVQIPKASKKKIWMERIWEEFDITLMQSELSFNFCTPRAKAEFQRRLIEHSERVTMKDQEPDEIFRIAKNIRNILNLDELILNPQQFHIPKLFSGDFESAKLNQAQEDLVRSINNLEFSTAFVNLLAWEQRISIDEALLWVKEYKKFLFISLTGKSPLQPSESINQVWRLHMQFSPDYETGTSHIRIVGGESLKPEKTNKQRYTREDLYERTLKEYKLYFGVPDDSIWPCSEVNSMCGGHWTSYYIYLARTCMTDDQKAKVLKYNTDQSNSETNKKANDIEGEKENQDLISVAFTIFLDNLMCCSIGNVDPDTKASSEIFVDEEPAEQTNKNKVFLAASAMGLVAGTNISSQVQNSNLDQRKQNDIPDFDCCICLGDCGDLLTKGNNSLDNLCDVQCDFSHCDCNCDCSCL